MEPDTIKFKIWIATNRVGSKETREVDVEREDWESMTESDRDEYMWDELLSMAGSMYEWGYAESE